MKTATGFMCGFVGGNLNGMIILASFITGFLIGAVCASGLKTEDKRSHSREDGDDE